MVLMSEHVAGNLFVSEENLTLNSLEDQSYLTLNVNNLGLNVKGKIQQFSYWFNSTARLSLLTCSDSEKEEHLYLLLNLKKQLESAISEVGKSYNKKERQYKCGSCNKHIVVKPFQDTWSILQNHEHFEKLFIESLKTNFRTVESTKLDRAEILDTAESCNNLQSLQYVTEAFRNHNEVPDGNLHLDLYINHQRAEGSNNDTNDMNGPSCNYESGSGSSVLDEEKRVDEDTSSDLPNSNIATADSNQTLNSFKFNFTIKYDEAIERVIYPESLMTSVRRIDRLKEYTIQKGGSNRAVCLLCICDLGYHVRISKHSVTNHVFGQRHLKFASEAGPVCILKSYHETWYKQDPAHQSHQIFFLPDQDMALLKCVLCKMYVRKTDLVSHIANHQHKMKVINLHMSSAKQTQYFLLDAQLQVYGNLKLLKDEERFDDALPITPSLNEHNVNKITIKPKTPEKSKSKTALANAKSEGQVGIPSKSGKEGSHDIIKSVMNPKSNDPLQWIPHRFKDHIPILKVSGSSIICTVCKGMKNRFERHEINVHLAQPHHLQQANMPPLDYIYYCEICNLRFFDEQSWSNHFVKGPNKHELIAKSRQEKVCEYECITCNVIIFGDELSLNRHLSTNGRKVEKKKAIALDDNVKKLFTSEKSLTNEALVLVTEAEDVLKFGDDVVACCRDMEKALTSIFGDCKAYPFGSRISGLGNKTSDLDVFIDIGGMYDGVKYQDVQDQHKLIKTARELFKKCNQHFYDITSRPSARTPIIRLKHRGTELDCDISFRHGLSVENTKFLRLCFDIQPISQQLILILKKWSCFCNFNDHITTYALAMMAIFYLQTCSYLLPVKTVRALNPTTSIVIDGWDTIRYTLPVDKMREFVQTYQGGLVGLLMNFFKYYADFDYKKNVVCPLLGETIRKHQFYDDLSGGLLPVEMKSYVEKINNEEDPEHFRALSEFCIQDPFDLSHNLTKACQPATINKLKTLCALSHQHLKDFNK